jgi:hypothetical protein
VHVSPRPSDSGGSPIEDQATAQRQPFCVSEARPRRTIGSYRTRYKNVNSAIAPLSFAFGRSFNSAASSSRSVRENKLISRPAGVRSKRRRTSQGPPANLGLPCSVRYGAAPLARTHRRCGACWSDKSRRSLPDSIYAMRIRYRAPRYISRLWCAGNFMPFAALFVKRLHDFRAGSGAPHDRQRQRQSEPNLQWTAANLATVDVLRSATR